MAQNKIKKKKADLILRQIHRFIFTSVKNLSEYFKMQKSTYLNSGSACLHTVSGSWNPSLILQSHEKLERLLPTDALFTRKLNI